MSCGDRLYTGLVSDRFGGQCTRPQQIPFLENVTIVDVSCGDGFTIALSDCGVVYAWGNNTDAQLGLDTAVSVLTFDLIDSLGGTLSERIW